MYSRDVHFHRKEEEKARIALEISKLQEEIVASKRAALKGSTIAERQEMEGLLVLVLMLMLRSRNFSRAHSRGHCTDASTCTRTYSSYSTGT